jgi:hypothetical protein
MRTQAGPGRYGNVAAAGLLLVLSVGVATMTAAQEAPSTWNFSLGFHEANQYDRIVDEIAQEDEILDNANATLGYSTRTQHARVSIFGRLGADLYRRGSIQNRLNYGGGISWDYSPSGRLRSLFSQNVSRGFMVETLSELGVLAPNVDTISTNTSWNLDFQSSPRTTLSTTLGYNYTSFETDQAIPGSQIVLNQQPVTSLFPPFSNDGSQNGELAVPDAQDAALQILATEGLTFRNTKSRWANAAFGVQHRWTQYSSFGFDILGGYRTLAIDLREPQDGADGALRVWALKNIGTSTQTSVNYSVRRSLALSPNTTIQSLLGGLGYKISGGRLDFQFQGGATYYQAEQLKSSLSPAIETSLNASLTRSTRLSATYQRVFTQSLGFGRTLLIDFGNLSLSQDFGSRVTATALAGGSFGADPLVADSKFDAVRVGGSVVFRIVGGLEAGTSLFSLRTEQVDEHGSRTIDQKLWSIFVNLRTNWH